MAANSRCTLRHLVGMFEPVRERIREILGARRLLEELRHQLLASEQVGLREMLDLHQAERRSRNAVMAPSL